MDGKHWAALHAGTPAVVVRASTAKTALGLRSLSHPDDVRVGSTPRILRDRTVADAVTRTERVFGARPLKRGEGDLIADATTVIALSGQPLLLHTADGDASLTLSDAAGRALWAYNAQKTVTRTWYELAEEGGRPQAVTENSCAGLIRTREYLRYGAWDDAHRHRNLVGAVILHHDNAGTRQTRSAGLTGQVLETHRRLLRVDAQLPDWAGGSEDDLEAQVLTVKASHDAVGAVLEQTNAVNVTTATTYDVSGAVAQTWLGRSVVLKAVVRLAGGAPLSQTAGNGVVETYVYAPRTHRLTQHRTARPAGHPQGALVICDLHYGYDPAGNILTLDDQGADPTWYRNAATNGLREYAYDTLYRLVSATGRERSPVRLDPMQPSGRAGGSVWRGYTERYTYDDGDNLTNLSHDGGAGARTRSLVVSASSNRAMLQGHDLTPDTGFLPGGLQKQLADGRQLSWLADNQLQQVWLISRGTGEADDTECYHYADGGTRTRKINSVKIAGGTQTTVTTYAGGCEVRQRLLDGQSSPNKHIVITDSESVRWVEDHKGGEGYLRYAFMDHLGSCGGETDRNGQLVSRHEFAPYGGTTGRDEEEGEVASLVQRTDRHAGKELDGTGLYYYGWRYYQADMGRWLSADPGRLIDGTNLYRFSRNNAIRLFDTDGRQPVDAVPFANPVSKIPKKYKVERKREVVYRVDARPFEEIVTAGGFSPEARNNSVIDGLDGKGFSAAITPHSALAWGGALFKLSSEIHLYELSLENTPAIYLDSQDDEALVAMMDGHGFQEYMMRAEVFVIGAVPVQNVRLLSSYNELSFEQAIQSRHNGRELIFQKTIEFLYSLLPPEIEIEGGRLPSGRLASAENVKIINMLKEEYYASLPAERGRISLSDTSAPELQSESQRSSGSKGMGSNISIASSVNHMVAQLGRSKVSRYYHNALRSVRHMARSCITPRTSA